VLDFAAATLSAAVKEKKNQAVSACYFHDIGEVSRL
jgi:hypothetical protein